MIAMSDKLEASIKELLQSQLLCCEMKDMLTIEVSPQDLMAVCTLLRDHDDLKFSMLVDLCGVDFLDYGVSHWRTEEATESGFSRGANTSDENRVIAWEKQRFAAVYHLMSLQFNQRLRIRVFVSDTMNVPSVLPVWPAANWFEREAFDLFGIEFAGHPDLRRILTDYGFKGHPFRKDFPLVGNVELRYDAAQQRCVYEPVSIQPRVNIPKVVRKDSRYHKVAVESGEADG